MAKKTQELRNMSLEELDRMVESLRKEIFSLRGQRLSQDHKDRRVHQIGSMKLEIARALTIKRERVRS